MRKFLLLFFAFLGGLTVMAQNRIITGKVVDKDNNNVANASVLVKGTTIGISANEKGVFSLNVPTNAKTLVISATGYASKEISLTKSNSYNVELEATDQKLDEVVVVAYGTAKKETLTGSVGQIKAADYAKRPFTNVTGAIEGAIPGVVTSTANGQPGSGLSIRVRGFGSINATSEPLLVVDGVPYSGGTSNINPDDVESTTILKDAAATALYGSRAANGVIMITTKKGKRGRNNISIRGLQGVVTRGLPEYERVNAYQYYPVLWEAYRNSLVYPASGAPISIDSASRVASGLTSRTGIRNLLSYNPFNLPDNNIVDVNGSLNPNARIIYGDDLDWTKELMRDGIRKDYSVNFSGGSDKSDYFLSMGYLKESGYTVRSDFERFNARVNLNVQPLTWFKTGLNISANHTYSNTASDGGSTSLVNPFFYSRNVGPIYPVYAHDMTTGAYLLDGTGNRFWDLGNMSGAMGVPNRPSGAFPGRHALAETLLNQEYFRRTVVSARQYADITFLKDFKFTNNVSVDIQNQYEGSFENPIVGDGAPAGRSERIYDGTTTLILSQLLNYGKRIGTHHRIDALIGHESYNQLDVQNRGFKQGQSLSGNTELNNFTTITASTSVLDRYRIESYFSRLNYDYKSKYFVSASIRRDGNSRFARESRWGTFWSVGGGWNLDKEDFMKTLPWINVLKLRGSYGVVGVADGIGTNNLGLYAYQGLYGFANNANEPGIVQSQTAFLNKNLTWETNKQFDIGIDFSLFKGRINGSFEYYHRTSADLLFAVPQPLSSGALTVNQNTATMFNKGLELQLTGDILRSKDFSWNMGVNLSTVTNRITKMPLSAPEFIAGTIGSKKYAVGNSIYDYWLRSYYGVDPTDGAALYLAQNTAPGPTVRLINNKSGGVDTVTTAIANGKFAIHGSSIPDLYGNFTQSLRYKNFTLSALFTFQIGGKTYDAVYQDLMSAGTYGSAYHTDILNRWKAPGDISNIPRLDAGRTADFNANSSRWLIDASYFNIRNVNLAYSLPSSLLQKINATNAQIFFTVENVAFFSKRKGMNTQQAFTGVTSNGYPPARIFTIGFTLNL